MLQKGNCTTWIDSVMFNMFLSILLTPSEWDHLSSCTDKKAEWWTSNFTSYLCSLTRWSPIRTLLVLIFPVLCFSIFIEILLHCLKICIVLCSFADISSVWKLYILDFSFFSKLKFWVFSSSYWFPIIFKERSTESWCLKPCYYYSEKL